MQVKDVMTKDVLVVFEQTPFKEIAELIQRHHVSAVPVLDHRRPVGVVSAADLLLKADHGRRGWLPVWLGATLREERKARGVCARDLMTSPVIVVEPEATISDAADLMLHHHVKRLPVVDASGKLVGIVSRSDLLKVFTRPDPEIKREIESNVLQWTLMLPPGQVKVFVDEGVVRLEGQVDRRSEVPALTRIVARVDGVVDVQNEVGYRWNDSARSNMAVWVSGGMIPPW